MAITSYKENQVIPAAITWLHELNPELDSVLTNFPYVNSNLLIDFLYFFYLNSYYPNYMVFKKLFLVLFKQLNLPILLFFLNNFHLKYSTKYRYLNFFMRKSIENRNIPVILFLLKKKKSTFNLQKNLFFTANKKSKSFILSNLSLTLFIGRVPFHLLTTLLDFPSLIQRLDTSTTPLLPLIVKYRAYSVLQFLLSNGLKITKEIILNKSALTYCFERPSIRKLLFLLSYINDLSICKFRLIKIRSQNYNFRIRNPLIFGIHRLLINNQNRKKRVKLWKMIRILVSAGLDFSNSAEDLLFISTLVIPIPLIRYMILNGLQLSKPVKIDLSFHCGIDSIKNCEVPLFFIFFDKNPTYELSDFFENSGFDIHQCALNGMDLLMYSVLKNFPITFVQTLINKKFGLKSIDQFFPHLKNEISPVFPINNFRRLVCHRFLSGISNSYHSTFPDNNDSESSIILMASSVNDSNLIQHLPIIPDFFGPTLEPLFDHADLFASSLSEQIQVESAEIQTVTAVNDMFAVENSPVIAFPAMRTFENRPDNAIPETFDFSESIQANLSLLPVFPALPNFSRVRREISTPIQENTDRFLQHYVTFFSVNCLLFKFMSQYDTQSDIAAHFGFSQQLLHLHIKNGWRDLNLPLPCPKWSLLRTFVRSVGFSPHSQTSDLYSLFVDNSFPTLHVAELFLRMNDEGHFDHRFFLGIDSPLRAFVHSLPFINSCRNVSSIFHPKPIISLQSEPEYEVFRSDLMECLNWPVEILRHSFDE
jgi:hypothetical protein